MHVKIETVVDGMFKQVKAYGLKEKTIEYYSDVCHIIVRHFNEKEGGIYSERALGIFKSITDKRCENGEICAEYGRFINRIIRMLLSYTKTGETDFSSNAIKKRYLPSQNKQALINSILDEKNLENEPRNEMDIVMRHFFCFIENAGIELREISDDDFFKFMKSISDTNKGSIGRTWRALRFISEYLKVHQLADLKANFSMLKVKGTPIKLIAPFSQEEICQMVECIDLSSPLGIRDNAILLVAFATGLRAVDIIKLKFQDIDWTTGTVHVKQSKTGKDIILPLNGIVMNAIADYILKARPAHDSQEIFLTSKEPVHPFTGTASFGQIVDKYSIKAGVAKKPQRRFHSLRRSFATEMSMAGVPLPTISQMLGHKSIDEDRPYLSYDRTKISFCALDFKEIPVSGGIYVASLGGDVV
jgi:site-specific recombinase XerD